MILPRFLILATAYFLMASLVPPVWAEDTPDTVEEIQNLLQSEKSDLDRLKDKISRQERQLSAIGKKETSILKTLDQLGDRYRLRERELKIYDWNIKINKKQMARLSSSLESTEKQLNRQKAILGDRIRTVYKQGRMLPLKALFSTDDMGNLLRTLKYMERVMTYDSAVLHNYRERITKLKEEEQALIKAKENLLILEQAALSKKEQVEKEQKAKASFLKKISGKKKYALQARKELVNASDELNKLISRLHEKLELGVGLSLADKKGRLHYPVQGKLISRFGRHKDRKYGTYVVNNGIDLKVPKGTPVRAIFQGKVLFAGSLEGYGNLVILGHGDNYHSLYGHLDKINVKVGSLVVEKGILGLSGDTGSLLGPTVYLELRRQGKPISPKGWFNIAKK